MPLSDEGSTLGLLADLSRAIRYEDTACASIRRTLPLSRKTEGTSRCSRLHLEELVLGRSHLALPRPIPRHAPSAVHLLDLHQCRAERYYRVHSWGCQKEVGIEQLGQWCWSTTV